jgi:hypothetical protein
LMHFMFIEKIRERRIKLFRNTYGEESLDYKKLHDMLYSWYYVPIGRFVGLMTFIASIFVMYSE